MSDGLLAALVTRQRAEIERLRRELEEWQRLAAMQSEIMEIGTEAMREAQVVWLFRYVEWRGLTGLN